MIIVRRIVIVIMILAGCLVTFFAGLICWCIATAVYLTSAGDIRFIISAGILAFMTMWAWSTTDELGKELEEELKNV